jgi:CRISPR/Cas system-associated protein Cas5 (RAMP superfamily)
MDFHAKYYEPSYALNKTDIVVIKPNIRINLQSTDIIKQYMSPRFLYDINELNAALSRDMERILETKGFDASKKFSSINAMSVEERRKTPIVFYPEIVINIKENSMTTIVKRLSLFLLGLDDSEINRRMEGVLIADANAVINIMEPFSAKKIWSENVYAKTITIPVSYARVDITTYPKNPNSHDASMTFYKAAKEIDNIIIGIYNAVIFGIDEYLDTQKVKFLTKEAEKLKM